MRLHVSEVINDASAREIKEFVHLIEELTCPPNVHRPLCPGRSPAGVVKLTQSFIPKTLELRIRHTDSMWPLPRLLIASDLLRIYVVLDQSKFGTPLCLMGSRDYGEKRFHYTHAQMVIWRKWWTSTRVITQTNWKEQRPIRCTRW